jgi:hypothetical protein
VSRSDSDLSTGLTPARRCPPWRADPAAPAATPTPDSESGPCQWKRPLRLSSTGPGPRSPTRAARAPAETSARSGSRERQHGSSRRQQPNKQQRASASCQAPSPGGHPAFPSLAIRRSSGGPPRLRSGPSHSDSTASRFSPGRSDSEAALPTESSSRNLWSPKDTPPSGAGPCIRTIMLTRTRDSD